MGDAFIVVATVVLAVVLMAASVLLARRRRRQERPRLDDPYGSLYPGREERREPR